MDRMNPLDASFLYLEDGVTHLHIASCALFDGSAPTREDTLAFLQRKLPLVPRYRQVVRFVPGQLGRPVWVDDQHFNLEYHVRQAVLPAPGGEAELYALMGRLMAEELDRRRPLWESWIIDGLAGGRWALVSKVHHCMVDGVSGTDLLSVVLDAAPDASGADGSNGSMGSNGGPAPWMPEPRPSDAALVRDALRDLATSSFEQMRAARRVVRSGRDMAARASALARGTITMFDAVRPLPLSSISGGIGPDRRWYPVTVPLATVKAIRVEMGCTVNDVVLAAVARGFRELLQGRGENPDALALRALIPVSVRPPGQHGTYDNQVSAMFARLPVHLGDPAARLAAVRDEMARLKASHEADAGQALTAALGRLPTSVSAAVLRALTRLDARHPQHSIVTVATNVPGPRHRLYMLGRPMVAYLPFVPIAPGARVGVAIVSYLDGLTFGITGDWETAPDIDRVGRGIAAEVEDLARLAGVDTAAAPSRWPRRTHVRREAALV